MGGGRGSRPPSGRPEEPLRLAGVCLFLVITTVILGLQVFEVFHPWLTAALIALAALFAWRVNQSPVRFGWV